MRVSFEGASGNLEGILTIPGHTSLCPTVVVCHPHPLMGGNMDNNVVVGVCESLQANGIASLRFNFRGVGGSAGYHAAQEGTAGVGGAGGGGGGWSDGYTQGSGGGGVGLYGEGTSGAAGNAGFIFCQIC